jgi:hypothetical protein
MTFAPLFDTLSASSAVKALIGASPVRCYPAGEAPQGVALPYCTYQQITGQSEKYLGDLPDMDSGNIQIDIYAKTTKAARAVAIAIRDAIEPVAYADISEGGKDPTTNNVRITIESDWLTPR